MMIAMRSVHIMCHGPDLSCMGSVAPWRMFMHTHSLDWTTGLTFEAKFKHCSRGRLLNKEHHSESYSALEARSRP